MSERYSPFTPDMVAVQTDFRSTLFPEKPKTPPPEEKPVLSSQLKNSAFASWERDPVEQARIQRAQVIQMQQETALKEEELNNIPESQIEARHYGTAPDFPAPKQSAQLKLI